MADERKEYVVKIGGVEHTMLLDPADAERLGAKARTAENKSRKPANKSAAGSTK